MNRLACACLQTSSEIWLSTFGAKKYTLDVLRELLQTVFCSFYLPRLLGLDYFNSSGVNLLRYTTTLVAIVLAKVINQVLHLIKT